MLTSLGPDALQRLSANLAAVRARIAVAAAQSGRAADAVRLIAITKYVPPAVAAALAELGLHDLGESRPQVLWEKAEALPATSVRWHLVGQLQRNKIRRTLPLVHLIHSVDSLRLLEAIERVALEQQRVVDVLLEVNVSGDANKQGLKPDEAPPLLEAAQSLAAVRVQGFMGMGGLESSPAETQRQFAALRELRERLRPNYGGGVSLDELSMGMSADFELAIAAGATLVRIGSILFEGLGPA